MKVIVVAIAVCAVGAGIITFVKCRKRARSDCSNDVLARYFMSVVDAVQNANL